MGKMIGRLPTAAAISLLMAICSVCGFISALVTSNMSTTYPLVFETTFPVVPTPSPSMVDDYTAPSLAVNPLLFADVLPLSVVGKLKTAQRRIASAASAKRKEKARQSKMDSFFGGKNKPQKQAGEEIDL